MERGSVYVGTSGFAYAQWAPRFYPPGLRSSELLAHYARRLNAVELNNTFYQQPKPERISTWLAAVPPDFRFVVKAQRGGSMRALGAAAAQTVDWLSAPYRLFGDRLGSVLFRVPANVLRDDERLNLLLQAWPADLPLTMEFQDNSWHVDAVFDMLRSHAISLCATDVDGADPPDLRLTGPAIYLRLRRTAYADTDIADWTARLKAFLDSGTDCYVFMRHDEHGDSAVLAEQLLEISR